MGLSQQQNSKLFAKDDEISAEKLQRWKEIRFLTDEEAEATLSGEELDGYKAHHQKVKDDIERAIDLAMMMVDAMDLKEVKPKSKGRKGEINGRRYKKGKLLRLLVLGM